MTPYKVKEKETGKTFLYWPPDETGFSICAETGSVALEGRFFVTRNDRGAVIKREPYIWYGLLATE